MIIRRESNGGTSNRQGSENERCVGIPDGAELQRRFGPALQLVAGLLVGVLQR